MRSFFILLFMMLPVLVTQAQNNDVFDLSLEQLTRVRITSATLSEQRVQDAPGAISVITRQDIERMGFRTLWEVLVTIPGFQRVQNDDEPLIAGRGIFATTNQKMLIMRDGNPLNEPLLDRFDISYLSLESIKKIEIIRGPSASLYGNPATAAVINIITDEEDRKRLKISGGNYGYTSADGMYSRKLGTKAHLTAFVRLTNVAGQRYDRVIADDNLGGSNHNGYTIIDQHPWNYDAGFRLTKGIFTLASSIRKHDQQYSWGNNGQIVRLDSLLDKPHLQSLNVNNEIVILPVLKNEKWKARTQLYANYGAMDVISCITPDSGFSNGILYPNGRILHRNWAAIRAGITGYASYDYVKGGNLLVGAQIERREYLPSYYITNYVGPTATPSVLARGDSVYAPGGEMRNAVYAQIQQKLFSDVLALNIGARYDIPQNFAPTFNPRLALIYTPFKHFTLKGVYAQGFQAPAYLYRRSLLALGFGSTDKLNSEILHNIQLIARYSFGQKGYIEMVGFHNQLTNLVTRSGSIYINFGNVVIEGIEVDTRFDFKQFAVFGNATLLLPVAAATDSAYRVNNIRNGQLKHLSPVTATVGVLYRPTSKLNVNAYGQYYSSFYTGKIGQETKVDSRIILNATIIYREVSKLIDLSISANNILNNPYVLGDRTTALLPQQGRWMQAGIALHLK